MLDELFQDFRISVRGLLRTPLCPWRWRFKAEPNLCTKVPPAPSAWNTALGRSFSQGLEDYAREDPHHREKEIGVIRHPLTQTVGN